MWSLWKGQKIYIIDRNAILNISDLYQFTCKLVYCVHNDFVLHYSIGFYSKMADSSLHFKLVLLGDTAVGKSCLVVRFVRDEFFAFQEPTIGGICHFSSSHM